ncbi:MAG: hypothetical protein JWQ90_5 [Hydrocarboniphaga sp.]|nr:hypothetical protein [Hydrocarboniphaga sp.]
MKMADAVISGCGARLSGLVPGAWTAFLTTITLALLLGAAPAMATTFTVTTAGDSGAGSLRQAIVDANADTSAGAFAPHIIAFAIPGSGVHTIQPLTPLPQTKADISIDGYTQPGTAVNTLYEGDNAVLLIELDGSLAGAGAIGLQSAPNDCCHYLPTLTVRGLVINRFAGSALFAGADQGCGNPDQTGCTSPLTVTGSFIGTDPSGTLARGNGVGIDLGLTTRGTIGAEIPGVTSPAQPLPEFRNLISGNLGAGIRIDAATASNLNYWAQSTVQDNYVGLDASGTKALANGGNGIEVGEHGLATILYGYVAGNAGNGIDVASMRPAESNLNISIYTSVGVGIGGVAVGNHGNGLDFHNTVMASVGGISSNNGGAGVRVEDDALVDAGGVIVNNTGLAIDLGQQGPNANDPGDTDGGANLGLNSPVVDSASTGSGGGVIKGSLDSTPNTQFEVHFYQTKACGTAGLGQAEVAASTPFASVTTDANGHADYTVNAPSGFNLDYRFMSANTRVLAHATAFIDAIIVSELSSSCVPITTNTAPSAGTLQFELGAYSVAESAGTVDLLVTRSGGSAGAVTAHVQSANGTATAGSDYTAVSATASFADGDTAPKHISVPILNDSVVEGIEAFTLTLTAATGGATLGAQATTSIQIGDDDTSTPPPPQPGVLALSAAQASVAESAGTLSLSVSRSGGSEGAASVAYSLAPGTATAGADYTAVSGQLQWAAGEAGAKTIEIPIVNDSLDESDESFTLSLAGATGATLGTPATATITIIDDDAAPPPPPPPLTDVSGSAHAGGGALDVPLLAVLLILLSLRWMQHRLGRTAVLLSLCAALASAPVRADDESPDFSHAYIGLRGGIGQYSLSDSELARSLNQRGHDVSVNIDRHEPAFVLYAGLPVSDHFALEIGYAELGEYKVDIAGKSAAPERLAQDVADQMEPAGRGLTFGMGGALPLTRRLSVSPHLALMVYRSTEHASLAGVTVNQHDDGLGFNAGLGLLFKLGGGWHIGAGVDEFQLSSGGGVELLSGQIEYRFE